MNNYEVLNSKIMRSSDLPLYWIDPLKVEADLNVLKIEGKKITVQDLLFYPEGGGQESDQGELLYNDQVIAEVLHVEKSSSEAILEVKWKDRKVIPEPPFPVKAKIQPDRRKALMRSHTSQHLVSAIFEKHGYETKRAEIHPDEFLVELDKDFPSEDLSSIIEEANLTVVNGKKVVSKFITKEEAMKFKARTPLKKAEERIFRVVEIEDTDVSFCGGTHTSSTSEIGTILLTNHGKRFFRFVVGHKASEMLNKLTHYLLLASKQVATSPNQALETLLRTYATLKDENRNMNQRIQSFIREVVAKSQESFIEIVNGKPVLVIMALPIAKKQMGKIMDELKKSETFIISTSDNILIIESKHYEFAESIFEKLKKALTAKGGGAKGRYTLKLEEQLDRSKIISILD